MKRLSLLLLAALLAAGCRKYDYYDHVSSQKGLIDADKFASYGRDQAIVVAIGREYARPYNSGTWRPGPGRHGIRPQVSGHRGYAGGYTGPTGSRSSSRRLARGVGPIADGKRGDDTAIPPQ